MVVDYFYLDFDPSLVAIEDYFAIKPQIFELTLLENEGIVPLCNRSIYRHENCTEICGDEITRDFACDLLLGNAYDGCDDSCEVEDKFSCAVDPLTKKT